MLRNSYLERVYRVLFDVLFFFHSLVLCSAKHMVILSRRIKLSIDVCEISAFHSLKWLYLLDSPCSDDDNGTILSPSIHF
jgi:hypothetical protein